MVEIIHSELSRPLKEKNGTRLRSSMIHGEQLCSSESAGSGGFGSVCKADYFGKTVALKKVKNKPKTGPKTGVAQSLPPLGPHRLTL